MHSATVTTEGDQIRWAELPGKDPVRVYVHGLGATSPLYFAESAVHPLLAGHRSLPMVHWISTYAKIRWRLGLKPAFISPPQGPVRHKAV